MGEIITNTDSQYIYIYIYIFIYIYKAKGKAIPVTGRGGPLGCETSRPPHFLDNQITHRWQ
jgi:hypothetical protein